MSITSTGAGNITTRPWQYGNQQVPDIVGNLRIDQAWGSAQVMGAYHQVRGVNIDGCSALRTTSTSSGWAFGAGLKLNVPMLGKGDYVHAQFTYSEGATPVLGSGHQRRLQRLTNEQRHDQLCFGPAFDARCHDVPAGIST